MRGRAQVAALTLGLLVLGVTGCGEENAGDEAFTDFVVLQAPEGWASSESGLEIAEAEADLRTDQPDGPVFTAQIGPAVNDDFVGMADAAFADPEAVEFGAIDDLSIDGFEAVAIAIRADGRVRQYVVIHPPDTDGVVLVLDAPEDRYEELREVVEDAVEITA